MNNRKIKPDRQDKLKKRRGEAATAEEPTL
jgi:hypothetical protein